MQVIGYLLGLVLLAGYVADINFKTSIEQRERTVPVALSGQLRAYASFVSTYAAANPAVDAAVSDAQAALPAWLNKPSGARAWAKAGSAIVYVTPASLSEAYAAARACDKSQICGVTNGGVLYRPGQMTPVSITLPSAVPASGAFVFVR